jgi:tetraacyldisaccharide 4'-kinase
LIPASRLFAAFARRRRARYAAHPGLQRRLRRPVISVGNVSMGGSGKTPLVALVARALIGLGHRPAILTRGYARPRRTDGAVVVSDGERVCAAYDIAGDEPLMLARKVPGCAVVVSADRYLAGALAERRLGCTVHVLDDGFQHLALARALDIVVVTASDVADEPMPAGRLREPLDAVRAADAVVMPTGDDLESELRRVGASGMMFRMARVLGEPRLVRPWGGPCTIAADKVAAFAGIGRPESFFAELERAGWQVACRTGFRDHYRFTHGDLLRLASEAEGAGAALLVTTEKDAVRLERLPQLDMPLAWVPMEVTVEPSAPFTDLLRRTS